MSSYRRLLPIVIGLTLAIGCSDSSSAPTSPSSASSSSTQGSTFSAEQLAGTWNLSSIQSAGQAEQTTPAGATYALTMADGRMSTRADCNACGGAYTLSGQTLTIGPALACTRAACPTQAFESVYTNLLSGESTVALSGSTLVLSSARGVLRFRR